MYDMKSGMFLWSDNIRDQRQVASQTKIMTYYTSLKVIEELQQNITEVRLRVSEKAGELNGTSAWLYEDDFVKQNDLLYGIFPSE